MLGRKSESQWATFGKSGLIIWSWDWIAGALSTLFAWLSIWRVAGVDGFLLLWSTLPTFANAENLIPLWSEWISFSCHLCWYSVASFLGALKCNFELGLSFLFGICCLGFLQIRNRCPTLWHLWHLNPGFNKPVALFTYFSVIDSGKGELIAIMTHFVHI